MEASEERQRARRAGHPERAARTVAQAFCLIVGAGLVAVGVLGFIFGGSDFGTGSAVQGEEFIGFEVNGWHNVVHIATGALLLVLAVRPAVAAAGALAFGLAYAGVAVWGFVDGKDVVSLIPVNTADNWLHVALAATGILAGLMSGALGLARSRETRRA